MKRRLIAVAAAAASIAALHLPAWASDAGFTAGFRSVSWSVKRDGRKLTLAERTLPVEGRILLGSRVACRGGMEARFLRLEDGSSTSADGLAGAWIDLGYKADEHTRISLAGSLPLRKTAMSADEARISDWLEETGLQMPSSSLYASPEVEIRAARDMDLGNRMRGAVALAVGDRLAHATFEGGSDLDPGPQVRLSAGIDRLAGGLLWRLRAGGGRDGWSRYGGAERYRDGDLLEASLAARRPGPIETMVAVSALAQGKGEAVAGWVEPASGSVVRGELLARGGSIWRWSAGITAWRCEGFDDRLADAKAIRWEVGVARVIGGHSVSVRVAPLVGSASGDGKLSGFDASVRWELSR